MRVCKTRRCFVHLCLTQQVVAREPGSDGYRHPKLRGYVKSTVSFPIFCRSSNTNHQTEDFKTVFRRQISSGKEQAHIMASLVTPRPPTEDPQVIYDIFRAHSSGLRIHTDTTIQAALLSQYPSSTLTSTTCDLIKYANAGHATATLNEDIHPTLRSWAFEPAKRQPLDGSPAGTLRQDTLFGRFDYVWHNLKFQVFVVDGQNSPIGQCDRRCYVLCESRKAGVRDRDGVDDMEALVLAASIWAHQSHREVWVYDQGRWGKDEELWRVVQGGSWEDLILDESAKEAIMRDVIGFFDARETYAELGTPWKVSRLSSSIICLESVS